MFQRKDYIGASLGDAFSTLGNAFGQKLLADRKKEEILGVIRQLQSQKDPRAPMSAGEMSGNLEQDAFQARPMFDEKNLSLLTQLPPQTLQLLMAMQPSKPEPFTLGEGQGRFDPTGKRIAVNPKEQTYRPPSFQTRPMRVNGQIQVEKIPGTDETRVKQEYFDPMSNQTYGEAPLATGGSPGFASNPRFQLKQTDDGLIPWNPYTGKFEDGQEHFNTPTQTKDTDRWLGDNTATVNKVKEIYDKGQVGAVTGRARKFGSKFFNDEESTRLQARLGQLRTIVYGFSGKQINEQEQEWLNTQIIPQLENPDENFTARLDELDKWLKQKRGSLRQQFKGLDRLDPLPTSVGVDKVTPDRNVGDIKTFPNGKKGRWDGTGWEAIE